MTIEVEVIMLIGVALLAYFLIINPFFKGLESETTKEEKAKKRIQINQVKNTVKLLLIIIPIIAIVILRWVYVSFGLELMIAFGLPTIGLIVGIIVTKLK